MEFVSDVWCAGEIHTSSAKVPIEKPVSGDDLPFEATSGILRGSQKLLLGEIGSPGSLESGLELSLLAEVPGVCREANTDRDCKRSCTACRFGRIDRGSIICRRRKASYAMSES